ncbi:MAG: zf-HC2 domain-containing protein [Terracidiphilus sp.]|jgi:hypothetical protein
MSATSQHGFHPDAESLSAFAEQALEGRERGEVLNHLAVCGRCRHVVALAREAADADAVKAPEKSRRTIEPNAWWRQWRLVWVPTAIVAAFAAGSISVYIEQADRRESEFKIVAHNPSQGTPPAATPAPAEQAKVEPPTGAAPASPPSHAAKHTHFAAPEPPPAPASPAVAAQMPPEPDASDRVQVTGEAPSLSRAEAQQAPSGLTAGAMRPAYAQPAAGAWEAKQKQAEEQRQADTSRRRFMAAKAVPGDGSGQGANQAAPPGATETVTVTSAPPLVETAPQPAAPALSAKVQAQWHGSIPVRQIHLPSALAVVSSTSTGPFMLAIDKAGALFLSEDQGDTWERVHRQWKGRAVEVTRQHVTNDEAQSAPAAQTETAPNTPANAGAAPSVIFELLNDKGQTWISTDGRTWTSK